MWVGASRWASGPVDTDSRNDKKLLEKKNIGCLGKFGWKGGRKLHCHDGWSKDWWTKQGNVG